MRITAHLTLALGLMLGLGAVSHAPRALMPAADKGEPELPAGLDPDQVRARLGAPTRIARQLFAHRSLEQWYYGPPRNVRLVFDCPRGRKPRLQSVHAAPP